MPKPHPFAALTYTRPGDPRDLSALIAPPYDVLDAEKKAALLARDEHNIVRIDLPHLPAKQVGPPEAYEQAAATLREWIESGVLRRDDRPAMFAYRQTFENNGRLNTRTGMACAVDLLPFGPRTGGSGGSGGAVLPHEETFSGAKLDRLELMRTTRCQLSPVFGLHEDASGSATTLLRSFCSNSKPTMRAVTDDGVTHEIWRIADPALTEEYVRAIGDDDVFIADGHHRYTTSLMYLKEREAAGAISKDDPARRCLAVLVPMSDPGLRIEPTHRVLGGMSQYSWDALGRAMAPAFQLQPVAGGLQAVHEAVTRLPRAQPGFGIMDLVTGDGAIAIPIEADPLGPLYPEKPIEWRCLDVALVQYLLVEEICQPMLNEGGGAAWAFPHTLEGIERLADGRDAFSSDKGKRPQVAVVVRPVSLESVRTISRAGALMPQKSTFFAPKLATGLFIHALF